MYSIFDACSKPRKTIGELARVTKYDGLVIIDHENKNPYWRISIGSKRSLIHLLSKSVLFSEFGKPIRKIAEGIRRKEISKPVMTGIDKKKFEEMILRNELELLEMLDFGPSWCPAYYLAICKKTKDSPITNHQSPITNDRGARS
ncbi:MAG TPA: hypothetical protein EYP19_07275 [Desulfobacterales bacterium]|nr:hypothetical protein [Desulfobacterales bacterium]